LENLVILNVCFSSFFIWSLAGGTAIGDQSMQHSFFRHSVNELKNCSMQLSHCFEFFHYFFVHPRFSFADYFARN